MSSHRAPSHRTKLVTRKMGDEQNTIRNTTLKRSCTCLYLARISEADVGENRLRSRRSDGLCTNQVPGTDSGITYGEGVVTCVSLSKLMRYPLFIGFWQELGQRVCPVWGPGWQCHQLASILH